MDYTIFAYAFLQIVTISYQVKADEDIDLSTKSPNLPGLTTVVLSTELTPQFTVEKPKTSPENTTYPKAEKYLTKYYNEISTHASPLPSANKSTVVTPKTTFQDSSSPDIIPTTISDLNKRQQLETETISDIVSISDAPTFRLADTAKSDSIPFTVASLPGISKSSLNNDNTNHTPNASMVLTSSYTTESVPLSTTIFTHQTTSQNSKYEKHDADKNENSALEKPKQEITTNKTTDNLTLVTEKPKPAFTSTTTSSNLNSATTTGKNKPAFTSGRTTGNLNIATVTDTQFLLDQKSSSSIQSTFNINNGGENNFIKEEKKDSETGNETLEKPSFNTSTALPNSLQTSASLTILIARQQPQSTSEDPSRSFKTFADISETEKKSQGATPSTEDKEKLPFRTTVFNPTTLENTPMSYVQTSIFEDSDATEPSTDTDIKGDTKFDQTDIISFVEPVTKVNFSNQTVAPSTVSKEDIPKGNKSHDKTTNEAAQIPKPNVTILPTKPTDANNEEIDNNVDDLAEEDMNKTKDDKTYPVEEINKDANGSIHGYVTRFKEQTSTPTFNKTNNATVSQVTKKIIPVLTPVTKSTKTDSIIALFTKPDKTKPSDKKDNKDDNDTDTKLITKSTLWTILTKPVNDTKIHDHDTSEQKTPTILEPKLSTTMVSSSSTIYSKSQTHLPVTSKTNSTLINHATTWLTPGTKATNKDTTFATHFQTSKLIPLLTQSLIPVSRPLTHISSSPSTSPGKALPETSTIPVVLTATTTKVVPISMSLPTLGSTKGVDKSSSTQASKQVTLQPTKYVPFTTKPLPTKTPIKPLTEKPSPPTPTTIGKTTITATEAVTKANITKVKKTVQPSVTIPLKTVKTTPSENEIVHVKTSQPKTVPPPQRETSKVSFAPITKKKTTPSTVTTSQKTGNFATTLLFTMNTSTKSVTEKTNISSNTTTLKGVTLSTDLPINSVLLPTSQSVTVKLYVSLYMQMTKRELCLNRFEMKNVLALIIGRFIQPHKSLVILSNQVTLKPLDDTCHKNFKQKRGMKRKRDVKQQKIDTYMTSQRGEYSYDLTSYLAQALGRGLGLFNGTVFHDKVKRILMIGSPKQVTETEAVALDKSGSTSIGLIIGTVIACIAMAMVMSLVLIVGVARWKRRGIKKMRQVTVPARHSLNSDTLSLAESIQMQAFQRQGSLRYGYPGCANPGMAFCSEESADLTSNPLSFEDLEVMQADKELIADEFLMIPNNLTTLDDLPENTEDKNRYANVIPYPKTRVPLGNGGETPGDGYINANFIRGYQGFPKCYIATQAPLHATVCDFWRMVWEQNSSVIIMLTALSENNIEKCAEYWPNTDGGDIISTYGDFRVHQERRIVMPEWIQTTLLLKLKKGKQQKQIQHFWLTAWPAHGLPDHRTLIKFMVKIRPFMDDCAAPPIVHCSPGTGRSGVFIALDIAMLSYEDSLIVNILYIVYQMRQDRGGMVQTRDQYAFIYKVMYEFAKMLHNPVSSARSSISSTTSAF